LQHRGETRLSGGEKQWLEKKLRTVPEITKLLGKELAPTNSGFLGEARINFNSRYHVEIKRKRHKMNP